MATGELVSVSAETQVAAQSALAPRLEADHSGVYDYALPVPPVVVTADSVAPWLVMRKQAL
jgi:hypothetical protein